MTHAIEKAIPLHGTDREKFIANMFARTKPRAMRSVVNMNGKLHIQWIPVLCNTAVGYMSFDTKGAAINHANEFRTQCRKHIGLPCPWDVNKVKGEA